MPVDRSREPLPDPGLGDGVGALIGGVIALLTLLVPLASVISDRAPAGPDGAPGSAEPAAPSLWLPAALSGSGQGGGQR